MLAHLKISLIVLSVCTLGFIFSTNTHAAEETVMDADQPETCGSGRATMLTCHRWYTLSSKDSSAACTSHIGKTPCKRRFSSRQPTVITLQDVHFNTDSSRIKPSSYQSLNEEATKLKKKDRVKVTIVGHTDSQGQAEYNQQLSEARANAVMEYFIQKGISPERLATQGVGEANPVADNSTTSGRAQNRRTEMYLD